MAKGIRVNRPKKGLHKNLQKLGRVKKQQRKKQRKPQEKHLAAIDPLTTSDILKKRRTNPKANITLSAKKRKLLTKKLQREDARKNQMEGHSKSNSPETMTQQTNKKYILEPAMTEKSQNKTSAKKNSKAQNMDVD